MVSYSPEEIGEQVRIAALSMAARDPGALAASISILVDGDNWKAYVDPADRRRHEWMDFRAFVAERLDTTAEALIAALRHAPALQARIIDLASIPTGENQYTLPLEGRYNITTLDPRGTAAPAGMRRLQHDRPDLAGRVEQGELSVHAAAVEAGHRKPQATVPIDSVDNAVRALLRRFPLIDIRAALDRAES